MLRAPAALAVLLLVGCAGCSSGTRPATTTSTTVASTTTTTTTPRPTAPTTAPVGLAVRATAAPAVVAIGTPVTFTVVITGPGVLSGENVAFGDGATTGANAGQIRCGQTARADSTRTYTHTYTSSGTFRFTDEVSVLGPPPTCTPVTATATATVVVAAAVPGATLNGAFLSPSRNLGCLIDQNPSSQVRCVSFQPAALATMTADGAVQQCTGNACELGNPSTATPVLPYGSAVGTANFVCLSTTAGITCTVPSGKGFTISRSGIQTIG